jgi:hypothetical protein
MISSWIVVLRRSPGTGAETFPQAAGHANAAKLYHLTCADAWRSVNRASAVNGNPGEVP